jgi:hypothetical protein
MASVVRRQPEDVSPKDLVLRDSYFAGGENIRVYNLGDGRVMKVYSPDTDLKLLERYKKLTERAAEIIGGDAFKGSVNIGGVDYSYDFKTTPIEEAAHKEGYPITISPYVPGPHIHALCSPKPDFHDLVKTMDNQEKTTMLREIHEKVLTSDNGIPMLFGILGKASKRLQALPDGGKIMLTGEAVKLDVDPKRNHLTFVVTDLMADLLYMKEKK